jgi:dTDP-4-dehydrorhamnose reductase
LKSSSCRWAILRTIIVYGIVNDMSRSNIVLWAKGALEKGEPINVVNDQWRMPTLAEDLAKCCLLAVKKNASGVFNVSGKDLMSILEIVERVADHYGLNKSLIKAITAESLNQAAKRPKKTGFILDKAILELGYSPHSFEEGMAFMDKQLKSIS